MPNWKSILQEKGYKGLRDYQKQHGYSYKGSGGPKGSDRVAFDKELKELFRKLELFRDSFDKKELEELFGNAAMPALDAMKAAAPRSKKAHVIKDDGGTTKKVKPGNLERSIQIFKARKSKRSVLVGPIVSKKSRVSSVLGQKRVSRRNRAFYWKFVYYGTARQSHNRFIDRARTQSESKVLNTLKRGIKTYPNEQKKNIF